MSIRPVTRIVEAQPKLEGETVSALRGALPYHVTSSAFRD